MGTSFDKITEPMKAFVERQHVFFVSTAPSGDEGRVNLSPKGYDSFRILHDHRVAYLDFIGSGAETIAHVRQNGRITLMFCAFEGKPNIVRFYGNGTVVLPGEGQWDELIGMFDDLTSTDAAVRSIIVAEIDRTSNSCGYAVPFMDFVEERTKLIDYGEGKTDEDNAAYMAEKNAVSIDGIPALS